MKDYAPALDAIRRFWQGEGPPHLITVTPNEPAYRQLLDEDLMVSRAVENLARTDELPLGVNLPVFNADFGTISLAAMYGGAATYPHAHDDPPSAHNAHLERLADTLSALPDLRACPWEESDFARSLHVFRRVEATSGRSDLFLRGPDLTGPLNVLALLIEQTGLILAMYDQPDLMHRVLQQITEDMIAGTQRLRSAVGAERYLGSVWPYVALPDGMGITLTEDFMPMLSPELYEEFGLPYVKQIAEAFGGVFVHCCGTWAQHLPAWARRDFRLWGVEFHYSYVTVEDVVRTLGTDLAYVPYVSGPGSREFPDLVSYARFLMGKQIPGLRTWWPVGDDMDAGALAQALGLL